MRKHILTAVCLAIFTMAIAGCDQSPRSQPATPTPSPTQSPAPGPTSSVAPDPTATKASRTRDALRYLADAKKTAQGLTEPFLKNRALSQVALAYAKAGEVDEAKNLALSLKAEAVGSEDDRSYVLADIYVVQAKGGDRAAAAATLEKARSTAAAKSSKTHIVRAQAKAGDYAGALATLADSKDAFTKAWGLQAIAVVQAQANEMVLAKATAATIEVGYLRVRALAAIVAAQVRNHDLPGARLTFDQARTTAANIQEAYERKDAELDIAMAQALAGDAAGATTSAALRAADQPRLRRTIAVFQARNGDFAAARASVETNSSDYYKALAGRAVAILQAKAGDVAGARRTLEVARVAANIVVHPNKKGGALSAVTAADARINGYADAERAANAIFDPYAHARALTTLAEVCLDPDGRESADDEDED